MAIGIYLLSYRDFYMFSYRPVSVNQMVIVFLTYYLPQHQHPAPGVLVTRSLALLAAYKANQQTTPERGPQEVGSSTRPCNGPSATPAAKPHPLQRVIERCSPPAMPTKLKGKQWLQCRYSAAMGLASWEEEDELYCYL